MPPDSLSAASDVLVEGHTNIRIYLGALVDNFSTHAHASENPEDMVSPSGYHCVVLPDMATVLLAIK